MKKIFLDCGAYLGERLNKFIEEIKSLGIKFTHWI